MSFIPTGWTQCPHCPAYHGGPPGPCLRCSGKIVKIKAEAAQVWEDAENYSAEKELQKCAMKWLLLQGYSGVVWHRTDKRSTAQIGVADLLACQPGTGRFCAFEAKIGRNKPTQAQLDYLAAVRKNGGIGFVFTTLAELRSGIADADPETAPLPAPQ